MVSSVSKLLLDNWDPVRREFPVDVSTLAGMGASWFMMTNSYFFLEKELAITPDDWKNAKARGDIRHCIPHVTNTGEMLFLDYVVHKKFNTLEDWAADAGEDVRSVLYGENRVHTGYYLWNFDTNEYEYFHNTPKYVDLACLLDALAE
jgi:hypothetical protein